VQGNGSERPPGAVVITARRSGAVAVALGSAVAVWVLALAASLAAQPTAGGKIAAGVIFGVLILLTVGLWHAVNTMTWAEVQVGRDAIVYRRWVAKRAAQRAAPSLTLWRANGEWLRILPSLSDHGFHRPVRLFHFGVGGAVPLDRFRVEQVKQACEAAGWRFDGDPARAVTDVQRWLHAGQTAEAAQLIELFGPFTEVAVDDDAGTSLVAAVLEDRGDRLVRRNRPAAGDLYQRAAQAQRAFAGRTPAQGQAAARLAEADRIDAKAEDTKPRLKR
jgi:hypothetical protein